MGSKSICIVVPGNREHHAVTRGINRLAVLNKCERGAARNGVFMANKKTNLPGNVVRPTDRGNEERIRATAAMVSSIVREEGREEI